MLVFQGPRTSPPARPDPIHPGAYQITWSDLASLVLLRQLPLTLKQTNQAGHRPQFPGGAGQCASRGPPGGLRSRSTLLPPPLESIPLLHPRLCSLVPGPVTSPPGRLSQALSPHSSCSFAAKSGRSPSPGRVLPTLAPACLPSLSCRHFLAETRPEVLLPGAPIPASHTHSSSFKTHGVSPAPPDLLPAPAHTSIAALLTLRQNHEESLPVFPEEL